MDTKYFTETYVKKMLSEMGVNADEKLIADLVGLIDNKINGKEERKMSDYIEMDVNIKVKLKVNPVQSLILQALFNHRGDKFYANGDLSFNIKEDGDFFPYVNLNFPERLPAEVVKKILSLVFSSDEGKDEKFNFDIVDMKLGKMKWQDKKVDCSEQSDVDL
jgi:hypothetical protein